ncbi:hypothetical protein PoB_004399900 [Plakobranchus ocellatus]|uniref:Uncharacterized protein n=1 Tax=Plakobranchus ocellatus TaxID=259542 RepID=A0AAV4BBI9_9GAST|nr:hypothetical protein PoB_004399900 [Plakobranchus ocellatus]
MRCRAISITRASVEDGIAGMGSSVRPDHRQWSVWTVSGQDIHHCFLPLTTAFRVSDCQTLGRYEEDSDKIRNDYQRVVGLLPLLQRARMRSEYLYVSAS